MKSNSGGGQFNAEHIRAGLESQLPAYLSDFKLFVDRAVTGSDYVTIIAYKEPSRWQQEAFGRQVVAPALFGAGALLAVPAGLIYARQRQGGDERRRTSSESAVYWTSLLGCAACWLVASWKRWLDAYPGDFPSRLRKDRRDIRLSLSQGAGAFDRTFQRIMRAAAKSAQVTDIVSPAEWGELLVAYTTRASRIDNGTPVANLTEALRAGAISSARNLAYMEIGAQAAAVERQLAARRSELAARLDERERPYRSRLAERQRAARDEYEHSTAVVALQNADRHHAATREQISQAEQLKLDSEIKSHAVRLRRLPAAEAEELHQTNVQQIRKQADLDRQQADLDLRIAKEMYQPGLEIADKLLAKQTREAKQAFDDETAPFFAEHDRDLAHARSTADSMQDQLNLRLNDEVRPRCDADDIRAQFSPPTFSIHTSIPQHDPNHRMLRDYLQKYTAESRIDLTNMQGLDSIRVALWDD